MAAETEDHLAALRTEIVSLVRCRTGTTEDVALRMASEIIGVLRSRFAGERIYFPSPRYDVQQVLADFDGRNAPEVCRKHGISLRTFYRLLRRGRKLTLAPHSTQ